MPVIACRDCLPVESFVKGIVGLFLLFIVGLCGTALHAQNIRIKLVDGRNGRAMAGTCINVWVGKERKWAMAIPTDRDGVASLRLTDNDAEINTQNQWKECGLLGVVDPVVKYADSIGINVGYVLCQVRQADHTWLATQKFSTEEVLQSGVVTANTCGEASSPPTTGEIVLFVRPLSWWEKLRE